MGTNFQAGQYDHCQHISIHVPREGHDTLSLLTSSRRCYFNPRAPRGARPPVNRYNPQFHPISIHVPREGHDGLVSSPPINTLDFNPRAPRGARRCGARSTISAFYFNPRAPRGARPQPTLSDYGTRYFNPRAPRGARLCRRC